MNKIIRMQDKTLPNEVLRNRNWSMNSRMELNIGTMEQGSECSCNYNTSKLRNRNSEQSIGTDIIQNQGDNFTESLNNLIKLQEKPALYVNTFLKMN